MKLFKVFSLILFLTFALKGFSQVSYNTFVANIMNQVKADSIYRYERQLCGDTTCFLGGILDSIKTRYYSSTGNIKAQQYIFQKFQNFGYTPWYQTITSTRINVLAKKIGTKYPNQYVIICSHFDDMPSGTIAPGADDNCSGTIAVLEAARVLANVNLPYTIIFAAWDEEELGLYGSKAYADTAYAHGDSIIGVLNFDMIAYDGNNDGALDVNTNTASMPLANDFAQIVTLYQPTLIPQVTTSLNGGSDHQSFQNRGYKAILSIEDNSDFTPYYHTVNDKYSTLNLPYFVKMIKAGVAALVTIAGDFKITITHTPIQTSPVTTARTAVAIIKSSYKIATGVNQPRLYYKINNGTFNYVNPSYTNLDTFRFTIPGQPIGTNVKYYIAAQDSAATLVSTLPSGGSGFNPPGSTPPATFFEYNVANQYVITIGTGTTSSNFPYTTYWMDGRTQYLFLASELGITSQSNITQIGFDVITADPGPMNNFKVSFQNTTLTSLTGFVTTGWTTCYSPSSYTVPGTGWQMITMTNPFAYTLGSNLLVEVCYNNSSYTYYSPVNSTTATGKYWGRYGDLSTGDGCATTTWSSTTAPPGRANTRLVYTPITGITSNENGIPRKFDLKQNYPNPFNPVTKINYEVSKNEFVSIKIYDMLGREIATLVNKQIEAGYYTYDFDASSMASGVYVCKMKAGTFEKSLRMTVLK
jgi:hypothetical protein